MTAGSGASAFSLPAASSGDGYYVTQDATYWGEWVRVENQVRRAEIIVHGVVTRIDPSRWNSPDGKPWSPDEGTAMPVAYTTFYVEPIAVLKGTSKWPSPIPFRFAGGTFGPDREQIAAAGVEGLFNLKVGDKVILFGVDEARYGKGAVYAPPAYWVWADALSLFVPKRGDATGAFVSLAGVDDPTIGETSEAQIRSLVEEAGAGQ